MLWVDKSPPLPLCYLGGIKQKARDAAMKTLGEDGTKMIGNVFSVFTFCMKTQLKSSGFGPCRLTMSNCHYGIMERK